VPVQERERVLELEPLRAQAQVQLLEPERVLLRGPVQVPPQVQALARVQLLLSRAASGWWWAQRPNTSIPARPPKWRLLRQSVSSRCCSSTRSFAVHRPYQYVVPESDEKVSRPCKNAERKCAGFTQQAKMARPTGIEPVFTT
jgi:hypothetical protein